MRARLRAALAAALLALGVCGLCMLSAALPADGYGLRFSEPLSAAQAEALATAAGDRALALTLWRESAVTLTTSRGRSAAATAVWAAGSPGPACPGRYTAGSAPGAGQTDGCAVSAALADALFGSRAVVGLELTVEGQPRRITGVFVSEEPALLCPPRRKIRRRARRRRILPASPPTTRAARCRGCCRPPAWAGPTHFCCPTARCAGCWGWPARCRCWRPGCGCWKESGAACPAARPCAGARGSAWRSPPRRRCRRFWPRCRAGWCRAAGRISIFGAALPPPPPKPCRACFSCPHRLRRRAARPAAGSRGCLAAAAVGFWLAAGGGIAEVRGGESGPKNESVEKEAAAPPRAG